jgi:hypothetical protein
MDGVQDEHRVAQRARHDNSAQAHDLVVDDVQPGDALVPQAEVFGLCPKYRLLAGTVNRTPSAEATSPPPHARAASIFACGPGLGSAPN